MSDHHYAERLMLQDADRARRESRSEAQRRAHVREALDERRRHSVRDLISGLVGR
jgi:hypothetical protein